MRARDGGLVRAPVERRRTEIMAEKKSKEKAPEVVEAKRCANCGDPKGPAEEICDVCGSVEFIGPEDERYDAVKAACQQRLDGPVSTVKQPEAPDPDAVIKGGKKLKAPKEDEGGDEPNPPVETKKERKAREKAEAEAKPSEDGETVSPPEDDKPE